MSVNASSDVREFSSKQSQLGVVHRTDDDVQNLSDVEQTVATAEDFIIYGKASVEIFDKDTISQKIEMDAFEDAIEQYFAQGAPISFQHKDVIVGKGLRSYKLDEPAEIAVGDESYSFEAGDTLETRVEDDTLWLVAHIYGRSEEAGSDASVKTRLNAFSGEFDGFSVTVKNKAFKNTTQGEVLTDIDWHSTTIGTGEQIKNPESLFGVAEFKLDRFKDALSINTNTMELNILNKLRQSSEEALSEQVVAKALTKTHDLKEASEIVSDGENSGELYEKAESYLADAEEKAESREDLVAMLADMTGMSTDEVDDALNEMLESEGDYSDEEDDEEMEQEGEHMDEEEDDEEMEQEADEMMPHVEAIAEQMGVAPEKVMDMLDEGEDDEDMEDKADADGDAEAEESVETESKSEDEDSPSDETEVAEKALTESEVEALIDEKMDTMMDDISEKLNEMESEVAEQVGERVSEKLKSGSTPEQDASPAEDGSRNLLADW